MNECILIDETEIQERMDGQCPKQQSRAKDWTQADDLQREYGDVESERDEEERRPSRQDFTKVPVLRTE
jgi:hypothetical protein